MLVGFLTAAVCSPASAAAVGNGTPESCTDSALDTALSRGGLIDFDCGPDPVTIPILSRKTITVNTVVDGGNLVTLDGQGTTPIFYVLGPYQPGEPAFLVKNLTLANARTLAPGVTGGAIRADGGFVAIDHCTITGSSSYHASCAAIDAIRSYLTISSSTVSGNVADQDSIVCATGTPLVAENSTFSGNSGHGIVIVLNGSSSPSLLSSCTVADNSLEVGVFAFESSLELVDTIVARNGFTDNSNCIVPDNIVDGGNNLQFPGSSCGYSIQVIDPLLDPLSDNGGPTRTVALRNGSPAINAGNPAQCPIFDQRGYPRVGRCDIGAFEVQVLDSDSDGIPDAEDDCPDVPNPEQSDENHNGIGDACDPSVGPPTSKEECRGGQWSRFNTPRPFKNQGDCIAYLERRTEAKESSRSVCQE